MGSRNDSMNTTTSFVTAKEELDSETDGTSTVRPDVSSAIDATDYVLEDDRQVSQPPPKMKSLGLGLQGLDDALPRNETPTREPGKGLRKKFSFEHDFDGDFGPEARNGGVKEAGNPVLSRNVTISRGKARRKPYNFDGDGNDTPTKQPAKEHRRRHTEQEVLIRDEVLAKTTSAIRHLKEHGIDGTDGFVNIEVKATPRHSRQEEEMARVHRRSQTQPEQLSAIPKARRDHFEHAQQDPSQDARKFSHSTQRSSSTVEAVVVIQPQQLKMRRTLRHKERMGSLRDFSPSYPPASSSMNGERREQGQRLRHKSVDLPQRVTEERTQDERQRRVAHRRSQDGEPKVSTHRRPERPRDVDVPEPAPTRSRQVSEQAVVPAQSREVSERTSFQNPQEHPRRSPLPELPREEIVQPAVAPEPPRPIQQAQIPAQPRPPQAIETQAAAPKRRYSIERKPVPIRSRIDSTATNDTVLTTDSAKARSRKALLAEGIIPVVIVPRRTSSLKEQSQPPSLRSTSTTRNSKAVSRASSTAPLSASAGTNIPGAWPESNQPSIRQRRNSDGGSTLTGNGGVTTPKEDGVVRSMDSGPPAIPVRRSSMSAPTTPMGSSNVSRSNSLTADSLRRHNEDQALAALSAEAPTQAGLSARTVSQTIQQRRDENRDSGVGYGVGIVTHSVRIEEPEEPERHRSTHLSVDTNGDPLFGHRLSAQVTPFSARSDVTGASHGTALEVAEARQVDIFNHTNTSVQLVHQEPPSSSASESIKPPPKSKARAIGRPTTSSSAGTATRPKLQAGEKYSSTSLDNSNNFIVSGTTNAKYPQAQVNVTPASPPQSSSGLGFGNETVGGDSPLINPRQPPAPPSGPPALKIIPPTPADLLAQEEASKQLGWEPPLDSHGEVSRPPRRDWSLRGIGGQLSRSLSLTRRNSERGSRVRDVDVGPSLSVPLDDEERPKEEDKLHPFWRPSNYKDEGEDCDCEECREYYASLESSKPQRPGMPRRGTSQMSAISKKMKKTFAILPIAGIETAGSGEKDDGYNVSYATARRTIKRSGSGNLKVVKRVGNVSKESLKLQEYLTLSSRRQRSIRRMRFKEARQKDKAVGSDDQSETPEVKEQQQKRRFSWVGGSTDSPAGKYPPAVRYPPAAQSSTYESGHLKRTFSLPGRRSREGEGAGAGFPPRVQVQWLGLGGLTRRLSEKGRGGGGGVGSQEERREGLKRSISAPRGVRDGVEEVLTRRQREDAGRARNQRDEGVQTEDFAILRGEDAGK